MFKAKIAAALIVSAALAPGVAIIAAADAQAAPYTTDEELYLEVLHDRGIGSGNGDDALVYVGYKVCEQLRGGSTEMRVISNVFKGNPGLDSGDAGYLVGAAQASFCEETHNDGIGF